MMRVQSTLMVLNSYMMSVVGRTCGSRRVCGLAFAHSPHGGRPSTTTGSVSTTRAFSSHSSLVTDIMNSTSSSSSSSISSSSSNYMTVAATLAATATVASATTTSSCEEKEQQSTLSFPEECLRIDTYNGITLDVSSLPTELLSGDPSVFEELLRKSLIEWKQSGKRGIWIQVPKEHSHLIPSMISLGFDFQYAKQHRGVTLTRWLDDSTPSRLPHPPTHHVGVGALVMFQDKMLVVQEKSGPAAKHRLWKMPTGLSDAGEDVAQAAIREVKEETNLICTFDRIICFRQMHNVGSYRHSDLFFVCLLTLDEEYYKNHELKLVAQEEEIAAVKWMGLTEFSNQTLWVDSPLYGEMHRSMMQVVREVEQEREQEEERGGENDVPTPFSGFVSKTLPVGFRPGSNAIYTSKL